MLIVEIFTAFVLLSILINIFVYKKFLYCELLLLQDIILIIPAAFIALVAGCVMVCLAVIITEIVWFEHSHLFAFIKKNYIKVYEEKTLDEEIKDFDKSVEEFNKSIEETKKEEE